MASSAPDHLRTPGLISNRPCYEGIKVVLVWTAPAEDSGSVTGYEILRAVGQGELATLVADTGSTTNTYTDATATEAGETYAYQVKAIRGQDRSQASGQTQVQLPHDPVDLAPSNLTAEKVDGGINLSWTAPAEDAGSVTGYEVLRAVGEGELASLAADTGSTATAYTDATATDAEETYVYQVQAIRGQARSQGSNQVIEAPEPPATPENLAPSNLAFVILEDGVELTWDTPAADAPTRARTNGWCGSGTRGLPRPPTRTGTPRPTGSTTCTGWAPSNLEALVYGEVTLGEEGVTTKVRLTWDVPAEGVEWIRGYEIQRATCDGGFTTLVADTGSTGTAYTDVSVTPGESYTYRVRARRPQGVSLTSNTWTILLPGGTGEGACGLAAGAGTVVVPNYEFLLLTLDQDTVLVKNTGQTRTLNGLNLNNSIPKRAQAFTTGASFNGYRLGSIGIRFHTINNTSTAGSHLKVTLNANDNSNPGNALCTLSDPATFSGFGLHTFDASVTCPTLAASTTYFAVIERVVVTSDIISLNLTTSSNEDTGGAVGWSIANERKFILSGSWDEDALALHLIEVRGSAVPVHADEFNTLDAAGNDNPQGIWSDGTTMWVSDYTDGKIYAYNMSTKQRDSAKDFNTLDDAGNDHPVGIWSDGSTMWVVDYVDEKIYAYDMDTKARVSGKDFNTLYRFNEDGDFPEAYPEGIWSDGDIMWVADDDDENVYAYDLNTKARVPGEDFKGLTAVSNTFPTGLWADETTMFVANYGSASNNRIFAYWISNKAPNPERYIELPAHNGQALGIWSDGTTMWVSDSGDAKIYAYDLPEPVLPPETLLSMERVTDTMAVVKVDVQALVSQFGSEEPAVSPLSARSLVSMSPIAAPDRQMGFYRRPLSIAPYAIRQSASVR